MWWISVIPGCLLNRTDFLLSNYPSTLYNLGKRGVSGDHREANRLDPNSSAPRVRHRHSLLKYKLITQGRKDWLEVSHSRSQDPEGLFHLEACSMNPDALDRAPLGSCQFFCQCCSPPSRNPWAGPSNKSLSWSKPFICNQEPQLRYQTKGKQKGLSFWNLERNYVRKVDEFLSHTDIWLIGF